MILTAVMSTIPSSAILYRKGDVNTDGNVNAMDSYYLRKSLAGSDLKTDAIASDVNSDNSLNSSDSYV